MEQLFIELCNNLKATIVCLWQIVSAGFPGSENMGVIFLPLFFAFLAFSSVSETLRQSLVNPTTQKYKAKETKWLQKVSVYSSCMPHIATLVREGYSIMSENRRKYQNDTEKILKCSAWVCLMGAAVIFFIFLFGYEKKCGLAVILTLWPVLFLFMSLKHIERKANKIIDKLDFMYLVIVKFTNTNLTKDQTGLLDKVNNLRDYIRSTTVKITSHGQTDIPTEAPVRPVATEEELGDTSKSETEGASNVKDFKGNPTSEVMTERNEVALAGKLPDDIEERTP